jgi:hypothetical protein
MSVSRKSILCEAAEYETLGVCSCKSEKRSNVDCQSFKATTFLSTGQLLFVASGILHSAQFGEHFPCTFTGTIFQKSVLWKYFNSANLMLLTYLVSVEGLGSKEIKSEVEILRSLYRRVHC